MHGGGVDAHKCATCSKANCVFAQLPIDLLAYIRERERGLYILESPSLDYAVPDASRLRFLEYPQSSGR